MFGVFVRKPKLISSGVSPHRDLEATLATVADCAITADRKHRVTYMNPAAEALTGRRLPAASGVQLAKVIPLVDTQTGQPIGDAVRVAEGAADGQPQWRRATLERSPRQLLILQYAVTALRDWQGANTGSVSILRDVTHEVPESAMVLADAVAPLDQNEQAQVTLDSIANGVISTNFRGRITFLNHIAERITGWTSSAARGRSLDDILRLMDPQTRDRLPSPGMRAIIEGRTVAPDASAVLVRRDGQEVDVEHSASPIRDKSGAFIGMVLVVQDVSLVREQAQKFERLALYDGLTGLANRTLLMDRLEQALERARRSGMKVSVLFVDLDRFKAINDALGHAAGDELLTLAGKRLVECVRKCDTVSRLGGDEFVVVMEEIHHQSEAVRCARKIAARIALPFQVAGQIVNLGASVGVASYPDEAADAPALLEAADKAMYRVKSKRRADGPTASEHQASQAQQKPGREAVRARR